MPRAAISAFLAGVYAESQVRGYTFDASKIGPVRTGLPRIRATQGQVGHEWRHLLSKLQRRSPEAYGRWRDLDEPETHPLFEIVAGGVEAWERA